MSRSSRTIRHALQHVSRDWRTWATAALLFIGIVARGWQLGSIPDGLNQDEAASGYDAFALLTGGIDRTGLSFPVYLPSWGSGMNALAAYLTVPSIAMFGLSPFSIRFPFFVVGVISLFVFPAFLRRIADEDTALAGLFLLSLNSWHIMLSRWGLESNMFPSFFLFGVSALAAAVATKRKAWYAWSGALFGLCAYAYGTSYAVLPVFLVTVIVYLLWKRKTDFVTALLFAAVACVVAAPMMLFVLINSFDVPTLHIGPITIPRLATEARFSTVGVGNIHEFFDGISDRFFGLFRLLGAESDGMIWNSYWPFGLFSGVGVILFLIGIPVAAAQAFAKRAYAPAALLLFWLLACVPVALLTDININRINIIFLPLIASAALGLNALRAVRTAYVTCVVCVLVSSFSFLFAYAGSYARESAGDFVSGAQDAVILAARQSRQGICMTDHMNMAYIQALVATKAPPEIFAESVQYINPGEEFQHVRSFGPFTFGVERCDIGTTDAYVLRSDESLPAGVDSREFNVHFLSGFAVYVRTTPQQQ